jgi:hypothetical protein
MESLLAPPSSGAALQASTSPSSEACAPGGRTRSLRRLVSLVLLLLPLAGCIEDRLSVEIHTQLHVDGTCTRRIDYVLERVDPDRGGVRVAFGDDGGALRRMHRFPSGEEWRVEEETGEGFHRLVIEATLPSPNDFDGDFFRARTPSTPPARNFISAWTSVEEGVYDYHEVFRDPVSPLAGLRALAREVARRDGDFARLFSRAFGDRSGAPPEPELRGAFHEFFADPLVRDLSSLTSRPLYGPRERRAFEAIVDGFEGRQQDLSRAVQDLAPAAPVEDVDQGVGTALDTLGDSVLKEAEAAGVSLELFERRSPIHFRATLVMPYPIRRCNACAMGDTAVWEFDEQDLYGRGFEMTATASAP